MYDVISNMKAFQSDMNSISVIWFIDIVNMAPPIVATAIVAFFKVSEGFHRGTKNPITCSCGRDFPILRYACPKASPALLCNLVLLTALNT